MATTRKQKGHAPRESAARTTRLNHSAPRPIAANFNGLPVSFMGDGWFNATVAAKPFGKVPAEWFRLPGTKEYIEALARRYGKIPYVKTSRARKDRGGGTWLHPKLAVHFTRWLDLDFSIWCDEQIDHILRGGLSMLNKHGAARSTTPDREPLLSAAAAIVARHRLPFGPVYAALNTFAGVMHAREMTCEQVTAASEFAGRLLAGTATDDDFSLIDQNRAALGLSSAQLPLGGGV